jgi:hypothetical protein
LLCRTLLRSFIETQNMSSMRWITERLRDILLGSRKLTKPVAHYAGYIDDYLDALVSVADSAKQSFAYRKGVVGQWGVIARGPAQGLPYVLRLLRNPLPEGRSAAAGILDAWSDDPALAPHLIEALATEPDIETLSTLMGTLGRLKVSAALPRLAELLRSPNSDRGDLSWSVIEALSAIVGERFISAADPKGAADIWLLEHGY